MAIPNEEKGQFKPGQSGNPKGRPKGARNRSTIVRRWLETVSEGTNPVTGEFDPDMTVEDKMTAAIIQKALSGDSGAYARLMDSAYGRPEQQVISTGTQDVRTKIIWKDTDE